MRNWKPLCLAALVVACGASGANDGEDQRSAFGDGAACEVVNQLTGARLSADELAKLDDPVAKLLLGTEGCPTSVSAVTAKLRALDTVGCADQGAGKPAAGVGTRLISEGAAESGQPGSYRTVISRQCGGRPESGLLLSGNASARGVGEGFLELIAQDQTTGVFDFYSQEDGRWTFFGTSADFIGSGYTCQNGQCTPEIASQTRCAGCHPGGGLNMKELHTPWVFWDDQALPGAAETIAKSPDVLGRRTFAGGLELTVTAANKEWARKRVELLKPKGTQEVLRSLFCTLAVNLQTADGGAGQLTAIPARVLVGSAFAGKDLPIDAADYQALLASSGARLPGGQKDTPFAFIVPERSQEDLLYVEELQSQGIVSAAFVSAVLDIDFTRPTFSATRCDLLKHAPVLAPAQMNDIAVSKGFKAALASQTDPAAVKLLANLNESGGNAKQVGEVNAFFAACEARPRKELLADVMKWVSQLRKTTRSSSGIIELDGTLPQDDFPATGAFDPKTCLLGSSP